MNTYQNIPIHAASGVHEFVWGLIKEILPHPCRVLDLGAGSGAFTQRLLNSGYDVWPMDLNFNNFKANSKRLILGDIGSENALKEFRNFFDLVIAIEVIEHVTNLGLAISAIRKSIAPEGKLIISTPNILHPVSRIKFLIEGTFSYFDENAFFETGHRNILPSWLLKLILEENSFIVEKILCCGFFSKNERGRLFWKLFSMLYKQIFKKRLLCDDGRITIFLATAKST